MPTFTDVLLWRYRETPDKIIITLQSSGQPDNTITYRDLILGAAGYAQAFEKSRIQPGEVVILILDHGEDLVFAFFGAILHGAIPSIMPFLTEKLSPTQYRSALSALIEISKPAAVVTFPEFASEVELARGDGSSVRKLLTPTSVQTPVKLDSANFSGLGRSPQDIVMLQHSSGTTGLQKGVALSHQAVFNQLQNYSPTLKLSEKDVIVSWLPLYHDMGLIAGFIMPVLSGIHLVLMSPFDWVRAPYKLMHSVSTYSGTLTWLPNFAFNFCAQKIRDRELEDVDLSSWRGVINCSEPTIWSSHQKFLERFQPYGLRPEALATSYAMAENVFAVTQSGFEERVLVDTINKQAYYSHQIAQPVADGHPGLKMLSAGKPIANTQIRVLDPSGRELPERHIGEIAIQSNCMLNGYYRRPDLTDKAFLDGWYLTGDLGYRVDRELYVSGRKKDMIIVGGKNIYPQDLERLAFDVDGVHPGRAVAFGVLNEQIGTEEIILIAEVNTADPPARQAIADEIRQRVTQGSDVALRYVYTVNRGWLLKTSSGKIARSANRDKYLANLRELQ